MSRLDTKIRTRRSFFFLCFLLLLTPPPTTTTANIIIKSTHNLIIIPLQQQTTFTMMKHTLILLSLGAAAADQDMAAHGGWKVEKPDPLTVNGQRVKCHESGVIASWCDTKVNPALECSIVPDFDEYGCACLGAASNCPDDCIGGLEPIERTHYGIRCAGVPQDEPNYILREYHALGRCENNALVSSWCDDYVNLHLTCSINPAKDEYSCNCGGKHNSCPDDCIGGLAPIEKTSSSIRCQGIPLDQPNYILE
jgi:hypothetical protein